MWITSLDSQESRAICHWMEAPTVPDGLLYRSLFPNVDCICGIKIRTLPLVPATLSVRHSEEPTLLFMERFGMSNIICSDCWAYFFERYESEIVAFREALLDKEARTKTEFQPASARAKHHYNNLVWHMTLARQLEKEKEIAQRKADGEIIISPPCFVTILDCSDDSTDTYFFIRGLASDGGPKVVYEDEDPIPPLPQGIYVLRSRSSMGEQLTNLFVGDCFSLFTNCGESKFRVLAVKSHEEGIADMLPHLSQEEQQRLQVYSGKGSTADGLDGSKYLGFLSRENGRFGSFPLHDDYGDESDPEGRDYEELYDFNNED